MAISTVTGTEQDNDPISTRVFKGLSLAAGACLVAVGLCRRSLGGLVLAAGGGYLAYRGLSRGSRLRLRGGTARKGERGCETADPRGGPWAGQPLASRAAMKWRLPQDMDAVDEASLESFPASDAPCYSGATATRSASSNRPGGEE